MNFPLNASPSKEMANRMRHRKKSLTLAGIKPTTYGFDHQHLLVIFENYNQIHVLCSTRKNPYSLRKVFVLHPSPFPLPPGNSSLASYFASKSLPFKILLPLGIPDDLPWGGYGFFVELHIVLLKLANQTSRRPVSSVGRVPNSRAGGRGFKPQPDQHSGSLNN